MIIRSRKIKKVAAIASAVAVVGVLQGLLITSALRSERVQPWSKVESSSLQ